MEDLNSLMVLMAVDLLSNNIVIILFLLLLSVRITDILPSTDMAVMAVLLLNSMDRKQARVMVVVLSISNYSMDNQDNMEAGMVVNSNSILLVVWAVQGVLSLTRVGCVAN
jgi:hypothetical protein